MRGIRLPEVKRTRALRRAATSAERKVWAGLRNRSLGGHKFVRQDPIGPYFADFACREARLVVEIWRTHSTDRELADHKARENFLRAQGFASSVSPMKKCMGNPTACSTDTRRARGRVRVSTAELPCSCDRPLTLPLPACWRGEGPQAFVPELRNICMPKRHDKRVNMSRRSTTDSRTEAEKVFKAATTKPMDLPPKPPSVPGAKETVSLRIDRDELDFFPGRWAGLARVDQRGAKEAAGK